MMATHSPVAVAISASPIPPVIAIGWPDFKLKILKELIMPTIVPRRPSKGDKVTITPK